MGLSSRDMLAKLVAFDTTSHLSNLDLIEFVEGYLADFGVPSRRFVDPGGKKANLLATIGPADVPGGIVLSGHTDVVPVAGQNWTSDPFTLTERDGRLYGRGSCDMKGFLAAALARVPDFVAAGSAVPVHLALSYDEEVGCTGVRSLVDFLAAELPKPRLVIVGEPSMMQVINAHKGINAFQTTIRGHEAHSSRTHAGVNSIVYGSRIIQVIETITQDMRDRGDPSGRFDPPFTTVHVGKVSGGTALNIIPRETVIDWEIRNLPDQPVAPLKDRFDAEVAKIAADMDRAIDNLPEEEQAAARAFCGIETIAGAQVPGLAPSENQDAEALMLALAQANNVGAVSYGTEAGHFQAIDIPTLICGPGSIDQAHKPDEFVSVAQLTACDGLLGRLSDWLADQT